MIELLAGMLLAGLLLGATGGGWALLLHGLFPAGRLGLAFLALTIGMSVFSITFSWGLQFGLSGPFTALLVIPLALLGWVLAYLRRDQLRGVVAWRWRWNWRSAAGVAVPLAAVCVAAWPQLMDLWTASIGLHIGPDGIGWATAAQGLGQGLSLPELIDQLRAQLPVGFPLDYHDPATTAGSGGIGSFTNVLETAYLISSARVGFPGVVGTATAIAGPEWIWVAQLAFSAIGLLAACIGIFVVLRERTGRAWPGLVGGILLGLNVSVLNAWHEGGSGQIYVSGFVVLIGWAVLARELPAWKRAAASGIALAGILPAYPDTAVALALALVLIAIVTILQDRSIEILKRWTAIAVGAIGSLALIAPLVPALISTTLLRSEGLGGSGWPQSHWANPAEVAGLLDPYFDPDFDISFTLDPRSAQVLYVGGVASLVVLGFAFGLLWRGRGKTEAAILLGCMAFLYLFFVYTQQIQEVNNYSYSKSIAMVMPLLAIGFCGLLPADRSAGVSRPFAPAQLWLAAAVGLLTVAVAGIGVMHMQENRNGGTVWVPPGTSALAYRPGTVAAFNDYNLAADSSPATRGTLMSDAAATLADMNWINRVEGLSMQGRESLPLAVLVQASPQCADLSCLTRVDPAAFVLKSDSLAVIRLAPTSAALAGKPVPQICGFASSALKALGGPELSPKCAVVPAGH